MKGKDTKEPIMGMAVYDRDYDGVRMYDPETFLMDVRDALSLVLELTADLPDDCGWSAADIARRTFVLRWLSCDAVVADVELRPREGAEP